MRGAVESRSALTAVTMKAVAGGADCIKNDPTRALVCLREDFRMFRPERMRSVAAEGVSFRPKRVALLRDYLAHLEAREE